MMDGLTITLPELLDDCDGYGMSISALFSFDKLLFSRELIDLLCWCR